MRNLLNVTEMYQIFKSCLLKIIPKKFILKNEYCFRKIYAFAFTGAKFQCPICEHRLRKFISIPGNDLLCPYCGSLSRDRRLYYTLSMWILETGIKILEFSPSRCLYRKIKSIKTINYTANDFCGEFIADKNMDITNMDEQDTTYDLIICYHILEHIKNDATAMSELFRILKPKGTVIIQTPFKQGDTYENKNITTDEDRKIYFGQEDHVRIYSVEGLCQRLETVGFEIEIINYKEEPQNYYGFSNDETIFFCRK